MKEDIKEKMSKVDGSQNEAKNSLEALEELERLLAQVNAMNDEMEKEDA